MGNLFAPPPHAFDKTKTSLKSISSHKTRVAQLAAIADDLDRRGAPRPAAYRWKDQSTSPTASRHMKRRAGPTRKVLYLARHGEATHNAAVIAAANRGESKRTVYDSEAYRDAPLTAAGREGAAALGPALDALEPTPELAIVSPLRRTCETAALALPPDLPVIVREEARELFGKNTPDRRGRASDLVARFPTFDASAIAEEDELWTPDTRESLADATARLGALLAFIRARPEASIVVVAHSGALATLCRAALDPGDDGGLYAYLEPAECRALLVEWPD